MLSLFPQILYLSPAGAAILRIAAGLTLAYIAYELAKQRSEIERTRVPLIVHIPEILVWTASVVIFATGILLFIGLYTQGAAIVGMIVGLKYAIFARRYSDIIPISRTASLLLVAICASLLLMGAGPFAFDLPL